MPIKGKCHSTLLLIKTYCYCSIIESLKPFYSHPGFTEKCKHSLNQAGLPTGTLSDIYDGRIWAEFQTVEGKPLLSAPGQNLALSLTVDNSTNCSYTPFSRTISNYHKIQIPKKKYLILLTFITVSV